MSLFKNFKGKNEDVVIDENLNKKLKAAKNFGGLIIFYTAKHKSKYYNPGNGNRLSGIRNK